MGLDENLEFHEESKEWGGDIPGKGPVGANFSPIAPTGIKGRERTCAFKVLVSAMESRRGPKVDNSLKAHKPMMVGRVVL